MHSVICSSLGLLECFVITKCTTFGQLILRKIIKIVATRCQILRLKCTKFYFGWVWELTALPQTPSWISQGLLVRGGGEGKGRALEGRGKEKGKGREGKEEGGESVPLGLILQFDHCSLAWCAAGHH